jgi:hypothetical protein
MEIGNLIFGGSSKQDKMISIINFVWAIFGFMACIILISMLYFRMFNAYKLHIQKRIEVSGSSNFLPVVELMLSFLISALSLSLNRLFSLIEINLNIKFFTVFFICIIAIITSQIITLFIYWLSKTNWAKGRRGEPNR